MAPPSGSRLYHDEQYSARALDWDTAVSSFDKIRRVWPAIEGPLDILDIGCGSGSVSKCLVERGHRVHGIDIMQEAVRRARENGIDALLCDVDAGPTPYQGGSFDAILMLDVLEHVWQPLSLLREAGRLLRETGFAIICIPNHFDLIQRWRILRGAGNVHYTESHEFEAWDFDHIRFFTVRQIHQLVDAAGFRADGVRYLRMPRYPRVLQNRIGERLYQRYPSLLSGAVVMRLRPTSSQR
jgi:methionine biosynthesis protein MetW